MKKKEDITSHLVIIIHIFSHDLKTHFDTENIKFCTIFSWHSQTYEKTKQMKTEL